MKKGIKWALIACGGVIVLFVAVLLVLPVFLDVGKYKPVIEQYVSESTGRPFNINGELRLSLFPRAALTLADLRLGNPAGFKEKDLVSVRSFEVRMKLWPLLAREIQVQSFVVQGPRIVLERTKDGRGSWEGLGKPGAEAPSKPVKPAEKGPGPVLPISDLVVDHLSIRDAALLWIDHSSGARREIRDLSLSLDEVSLDKPINITLAARLDGQDLSLKGLFGPLGRQPGQGRIPMDLSLEALGRLKIKIRGALHDPLVLPRFNLSFQVEPFSIRDLAAALGQKFPLTTADPNVLNRISAKARLQGSPQNVELKEGFIGLDDSKILVSARLKAFSKPDVAFVLKLDQIDLTRYLPPPSQQPETKGPKAKAPPEKRKEKDYTPLRRLVLDGEIRAEKVRWRKTQAADVHLKVRGRNGVFNLAPLSLEVYQGRLSVQGQLDLRRNVPQSRVKVRTKGLRVRPLLRDFLKKDFLEGTTQADITLRMAGDTAAGIKKTLTGRGVLRFYDGAVVGIDLAGMVSNVKAAFGSSDRGEARTEFSELVSPFTMTKGVFQTSQTTLKSPLLRVTAAGRADLNQDTLDFRVEPKLVATLKGQGDTIERSGLMVPVLVGGSFAAPKFRPDLAGLLKQKIEKKLPVPQELDRILQGQRTQKAEPGTSDKRPEDLLKGLGLSR